MLVIMNHSHKGEFSSPLGIEYNALRILMLYKNGCPSPTPPNNVSSTMYTAVLNFVVPKFRYQYVPVPQNSELRPQTSYGTYCAINLNLVM